MSEENKNTKQVPYRVLARKYRPQNFDDLVGQDALVRTLKNAIDSGRIAHAFMLTGIRGVGKTTTARIIAKALNYTGADGKAEPTTGATDDCAVCQAITEDRHPDVMEMDAASRTGIDDIREILDGVRYAPTSARYKVYIIDEVHMLSKAAFNALLKTLEEPPEHVKFIFATTEIRKVPITVLSRCQRFDLRRIDADVLADYYGQIAEKENVTVEDEAMALISRAADGSARDGLSLLDQAIALCGMEASTGTGHVSVTQVKEMLGLADRALILDLLEHALKGKSAEALELMSDLYRKGADPVVIMQDLLELSHLLTKLRVVPALKGSTGVMAKGEQERAADLADHLSMPVLGRTWQILLKGLGEVNMAPNPQKAAEMVIIRLAYAADLPDPAALVKKLKDQPVGSNNSSNSPSVAANSASTSTATASTMLHAPVEKNMSASGDVQGGTQPQTVGQANIQTNIQKSVQEDVQEDVQEGGQDIAPSSVQTMADIVAILEKEGAMILATQVRMFAHSVKVAQGLVEFRPAADAPDKLAQELTRALKAATQERWVVSVSNQAGQKTLMQLAQEEAAKIQENVMEQPLMKNIFKLFPDAKLKEIHKKN